VHDWDMDEYRAKQREAYEAIRAKHPALVTRGFSCFAGWFPILDSFFGEVEGALVEAPQARFDLWRVKEKFGRLRVYYVAPRSDATSDDSQVVREDNVRRRIDEAYERAEQEAKRTCDVCGEAGALRVRNGWFATRCEEHADGGVPYRPKGDAE